jgi:hypothetical protein
MFVCSPSACCCHHRARVKDGRQIEKVCRAEVFHDGKRRRRRLEDRRQPKSRCKCEDNTAGGGTRGGNHGGTATLVDASSRDVEHIGPRHKRKQQARHHENADSDGDQEQMSHLMEG